MGYVCSQVRLVFLDFDSEYYLQEEVAIAGFDLSTEIGSSYDVADEYYDGIISPFYDPGQVHQEARARSQSRTSKPFRTVSARSPVLACCHPAVEHVSMRMTLPFSHGRRVHRATTCGRVSKASMRCAGR